LGYPNTSQTWLSIAKSVAGMPHYVGRNNEGFREDLSFHGVFLDPRRRYINPTGRRLNLPFAIVELLDILRNKNPGLGQFYNKQMVHFINPVTGTYDGHYGSRIAGQPGYACEYQHQLYRITSELDRSNSRRAVVTIHNPLFENWDGADVCCTLSLQFIKRGNLLHLVTTMRSEDLYLGYCYDTFQFQMLQEIIASIIGCGLGNYYHNVGSLHIYDRDVGKLQSISEYNVYKEFPVVSMRPASFAEFFDVEIPALWEIASNCVQSRKDPASFESARSYLDLIKDPYLMNCAWTLLAEERRRAKDDNEMEWRSMINNEFEHYFVNREKAESKT
jgi:thymidylate synthase